MSFSDYIGIQTREVSTTKVILALPITDTLKQPFGILHGGINAVLAEEAASRGALATLDAQHVPIGINITTHHYLPATQGTLIATATPEFIGHTLQTWQVRIILDQKLTSTSTVTLTIKPRP